MGVHKLTRFIHENQSRIAHAESFTRQAPAHERIVVDALSAMFHAKDMAASFSDKPGVFGGSPADWIHTFRQYIRVWISAGFDPVFVFDGVTPLPKWKTEISRKNKRLIPAAFFDGPSFSLASVTRDPRNQMHNVFLGKIFIDVLKSERIKYIIADDEADEFIARLAAKTNAAIVSADSDFAILARFPGCTGYVDLRALTFLRRTGLATRVIHNAEGIRWSLLDPLALANVMGIHPAHLPLLPVFLGDDFVDSRGRGPLAPLFAKQKPSPAALSKILKPFATKDPANDDLASPVTLKDYTSLIRSVLKKNSSPAKNKNLAPLTTQLTSLVQRYTETWSPPSLESLLGINVPLDPEHPASSHLHHNRRILYEKYKAGLCSSQVIACILRRRFSPASVYEDSFRRSEVPSSFISRDIVPDLQHATFHIIDVAYGFNTDAPVPVDATQDHAWSHAPAHSGLVDEVVPDNPSHIIAKYDLEKAKCDLKIPTDVPLSQISARLRINLLRQVFCRKTLSDKTPIDSPAASKTPLTNAISLLAAKCPAVSESDMRILLVASLWSEVSYQQAIGEKSFDYPFLDMLQERHTIRRPVCDAKEAIVASAMLLIHWHQANIMALLAFEDAYSGAAAPSNVASFDPYIYSVLYNAPQRYQEQACERMAKTPIYNELCRDLGISSMPTSD